MGLAPLDVPGTRRHLQHGRGRIHRGHNGALTMSQKHVRRPLRYAPGQGYHRRQTVSLGL
eukprot:14416901-Alexandrium_andersonii.AAC.1